MPVSTTRFVPSRLWLALPGALGVIACERGLIAAKLGVPLACTLILAACGRPRWLARRDLALLAVALVFSAAGDWFLSTRGGQESRFLAGIGLFFVAHLGYLGCSRCHGPLHRRMLAGALLVFVPYYLLALHPAIRSPALAFAVLAYLLVSCVALSCAAGMRLPGPLRAPYLAGIGLIVFSDTIISFKEFLGFHAWDFLILPTYYLAHLCVTWTGLALPEPSRSLARRRQRL